MLAMFYLILKRLRGVTFRLLSHKGRCYHQQQPTWSQPLDWVFIVLFICVRGFPFSHFHILRCYFHIATSLWCDKKAAAIKFWIWNLFWETKQRNISGCLFCILFTFFTLKSIVLSNSSFESFYFVFTLRCKSSQLLRGDNWVERSLR